MYTAVEFEECVSCEQLIFPGDEVFETRDGVFCTHCVSLNQGLAPVSY